MPSEQEQFDGFSELDELGALNSNEQLQFDQLKTSNPNLTRSPAQSQQNGIVPTPPIETGGGKGELFDNANVGETPTLDGRSFLSAGTELGLEITGSIMGVLASKAKPVKQGLGSLHKLLRGKPVTSASLGSGAGQAAFQGLQHVDEESFGPAPTTGEEALGEISFAAGSDALFGGVATGIGKITNKFNPLAHVSDEQIETLEFFKRNVGTENLPLSSIIPESKMGALGENLSEGSLFSEGTFKANRNTVEKILQNGLQHQADMIAKGSREEISKTVVSVLKKKTKAQSKALSDIASRVELMLKERGSSFSTDVTDANKFLSDNFADIPGGLKGSRELKFFSKNVLTSEKGKILNIGGEGGNVADFGKNKLIPFKKVQDIINDLSEDIATLDKKGESLFGLDNATKFKGKLKTLRTKLNNSLAKRIKGAGDPELAKAFRTMQNISFQGHARFNEQLLTKLMKSDDLAATVVLNTVKSPNEMRRLKHLMGKDWRRVEGLAFQDLVRKHTKRISGKKVLSGDGLLNTIDKMDPSLKKVLYNHNSMKKFTEFAEVLGQVQGDKITNAGTVFIELAQAGAFTSMLFGGPSLASSLILLGPVAFEKLFTHPKIIDKMIKAIKRVDEPGLSTGSAITSSILSDMTKAGIDYTRASDPISRAQNNLTETLSDLSSVGANIFAD